MWVEVMSISILVLNCSPAKFKFCNLSPKVNFLDSRISLRHFYPSNGRFVAKLLIIRRQIHIYLVSKNNNAECAVIVKKYDDC